MNTYAQPADARHYEVAIVHNHWIHYKDLLFRAMMAHQHSFVVLFAAATSTIRLGAADALAVAPYRFEVGCTDPYEEVNQLGAAFRTWRSLTRLRPAVLIISGWYDGPAWAAWAWGIAHQVPMILWSESNVFDRPRHRLREAVKRLYLKAFANYHVYGQSNAEYLQLLGVAPDSVRTKRAVLDVRHFVRDPAVRRDPEQLTLLYVGRFSPEKNLESLLFAMKRLHAVKLSRPTKLLLVGYGPSEERLRELAGTLGLCDCVSFEGTVSQQDLPKTYSRADVLVLPSLSEAWGLVVNEAMCCEMAVAVSSRCGCAKDLVTADTGWTFDAASVESLWQTLREITLCPANRLEYMGRKARELAAVYSPENCARLVSDAISRVPVSVEKRRDI